MVKDHDYEKLKFGKTYGEPTHEKMEQIWEKMKNGCSLDYNSSFLDIGSGFGKMVFLVGLLENRIAHGIEIVPFRVTSS